MLTGGRKGIVLYTRNARIKKIMREQCSGTIALVVRNCKLLELPRRAHYVVSCAALSGPLERFAAGHGAMAVVIPEGTDYLIRKAGEMTEEVIVLGADFQIARPE